MNGKTRYVLIGSLLCTGFLSCSDAPEIVPVTPPETEQPRPSQPEEPKEEPTVYPANTSQLWKEFVENGKQGTETRLADFSYAGYRFGEEAVPDVDYPVFDVTEYGAVPDDGKDDREAFLKAIKAAQDNGKGIIYFPKGRFDLRPKDAPNESIIISGNNLILRGAGSGEGGTEIFMEYPHAPATEGALWSCPALIAMRYVHNSTNGAVADRQLTTLTADAPRGSFTIEVASTSGLNMGKRVFLNLKNNDPALIADELQPYEAEADWTNLLNNGVQVTEYHEIARIDGNRVTFKDPILHRVDARWGWTLHEHSHVQGMGVEDIAFVGNFQEPFVHHQNATHDSGFKMLTLLRQVNSWVRRCRFTDVSEAISVQRSANVSVYSCSITGHQGHSAIRSEASTRVFIGAIDDQPAQFHSTGVSKTAIGTVLWRNTTASNSCFESHADQPRVTLLDACRGGFIPNHAGGDQAAAPNHLGELVMWNYTNTAAGGDFDLWCRNNRFLMPVIAGFQGNVIDFDPRQVTINESPGTAVYPESLYEAQLMQRLGYLPEWIQALK